MIVLMDNSNAEGKWQCFNTSVPHGVIHLNDQHLCHDLIMLHTTLTTRNCNRRSVAVLSRNEDFAANAPQRPLIIGSCG